MAERATPTVELASVGVTIIPSLKGMAKQIRNQVAEGTKGAHQAITAELNKSLGAHTKNMRNQYKSVARAYRTEMGKIKPGEVPGTTPGAPGRSVALTRRQRREQMQAERAAQSALFREQAANIARSLARGIGGAFSAIGRGVATLSTTFGRGINRMVGSLAPTLRTLSGGIRSLGGRMMNYVVPPATAAAAAIGAIGVNAMRTGAQYNTLQQTTRAGLKTLLGSAEAANAQMEKLNEFTTTSPFAKQTFIEAQQQLLAFNFAAEEVIPTLDAIQNTVAAMGGSNQQISEIANIFGKIRSSQLLSMQDINQLAERGINAPKLLAEAMNTTEEAMREDLMGDPVRGRDAIDALNIIINQLAEKNRGAAEGVKNTWVGAIDRIKAAWRDASSWLMTPFIDPMGGGMAIEWANGIADSLRQIERAIREFVTENRGEIEAFFEPVGRAIRNTTEALREFNGSDISTFLRTLNEMKDVLIPLGVFFGVVFGSSLLSGIPLLGSLVPTIGPLAGALLAVSAISPELRSALGDLFGVILSGIPPLMPVLERFIQILETSFIATITAITPYVDRFMQALPGLADGLLGLVEQIAAAGVELMPTIMEIAGMVGDFLIQALQALAPYLPIIVSAILELGQAFGQAFADIWEVLGPELPSIINILVAAFLELVDVVIAILPHIVDLLSFIIQNHEAFFMLATIAAVAWGAIKLFGGVSALLMPAFGGISGLMTGISGVAALAALKTGSLAAIAIGAIGLLAFGIYDIATNWDEFLEGAEATFGLIGEGAAWLGRVLVEAIFGLNDMLIHAAEGIGSILGQIGKGIGDAFDPIYGWITGRDRGTNKQWNDPNHRMSVPRYANGGLVPATPGGRLLIAGEAGRNEIIADEGLFNRNLELQNKALAGVIASGGGANRAPVIIEQVTLNAGQNESNESLMRRFRRVMNEPDLAAGY